MMYSVCAQQEELHSFFVSNLGASPPFQHPVSETLYPFQNTIWWPQTRNKVIQN